MHRITVPLMIALCAVPVHAQEQTIVTTPPIGAESRVPAGGEVYSYVRVYSVPAFQLEADTKAGSWLIEQPVPRGTKLVPVATKKAAKGCVPQPGTLSASGPCFIDDNGDGTFDRHAGDEVQMFRKLSPPIPYSRTTLEIARADSFKRVFLFQGATADSLRFSYREFKDDMARPAFTEELSIPREPFPAMIMLKDLQIEVQNVSGMGLTYRVVKAM